MAEAAHDSPTIEPLHWWERDLPKQFHVRMPR
jgi:hypothetical protein